RERVRDGRVATDLTAVAGLGPVREHALRSVKGSDRVEHRQRRLRARAPADLGFRQPDTRVALEKNMREVAPLRAFTNQADLRIALDRHLILDERGDALGGRSGVLRQRRAAIGKDTGITVVVRGARPGYGSTHGVPTLVATV